MHAEAEGIFAGKRLVVFGAGYLGGEFARQARGRGLRVTALTRNPVAAAALAAAGVEPVVGDLADDGWHAAIPGAADFVLNAVGSGGDGLAGYRRSYHDGMRSILAWARARGAAGVMAYTSSTSVYPQDGGVRVDELAEVSPRDERAAVLIETEGLLRDALAGSGGAPVAARAYLLRLAGLYGPGRHFLLDQIRRGEVAGSGEHHLNLIHRDDACAAVWAVFGATGHAGPTVFNVADDTPLRKAEAVAWLAARIGVPAPRFSGLPVTGRRAATPDRIILNARLRTSLPWVPRFPSLREGYANLLSR